MSAAWADRALLAGAGVTVAAVAIAASSGPTGARGALRGLALVVTAARTLLGA